MPVFHTGCCCSGMTLQLRIRIDTVRGHILAQFKMQPRELKPVAKFRAGESSSVSDYTYLGRRMHLWLV